MMRKYFARHDKFACVTLREQPEELALAQPRSVHTVEFDYFSPVGFVSQSYIPSRKGRSQVYGNSQLMPTHMFNVSGFLYSPACA